MSKDKVVLDTSAIITSSKFILKYIEDYEFIICSTVASELDNMKESDSNRRSFNGRNGLRFIEENEDAFTFIESKHMDLNDDSIIECAKEHSAMIATKDRGMWIKCKAQNVDIFELDDMFQDINYKGYKVVVWDCMDENVAEQLNSLAVDSTQNIFGLDTNEFVILKDKSCPIFDEEGISDDYQIKSIMQWDGHKMVNLKYKNIDNSFSGKVQPRNLQQKMLFHLMQDNKITIKLCSGGYGTGKDYVMLTNALDLVQKHVYDKIVWFRNNVNVKGIKDMGYLPGTYAEKSAPYSAVLDDILGEQFGTDMFIGNRQLEIGNLGAVRGRTFKNSIIFLTEMQNCSVDVIQLLISRVGEGSILVMNGDFKQIDSVNHSESSIKDTIDVLHGHEKFGWVNLEKIERSDTADLARLFDEV